MNSVDFRFRWTLSAGLASASSCPQDVPILAELPSKYCGVFSSSYSRRNERYISEDYELQRGIPYEAILADAEAHGATLRFNQLDK